MAVRRNQSLVRTIVSEAQIGWPCFFSYEREPEISGEVNTARGWQSSGGVAKQAEDWTCRTNGGVSMSIARIELSDDIAAQAGHLQFILKNSIWPGDMNDIGEGEVPHSLQNLRRALTEITGGPNEFP